MSGADRAYLRVRVVPRASRTRLSRDAQGALRAHLTAAPVDGAANRALIALLAATLAIPKRAIAVARGERARDKLVCIQGVASSDVEARVARALGSGVDKT